MALLPPPEANMPFWLGAWLAAFCLSLPPCLPPAVCLLLFAICSSENVRAINEKQKGQVATRAQFSKEPVHAMITETCTKFTGRGRREPSPSARGATPRCARGLPRKVRRPLPAEPKEICAPSRRNRLLASANA